MTEERIQENTINYEKIASYVVWLPRKNSIGIQNLRHAVSDRCFMSKGVHIVKFS